MKHFKVSAPTRVDLAGGTLDLWPLYCLLDGAKTINAAIDLKAVVEFQATDALQTQVSLTGFDGKSLNWEPGKKDLEIDSLAPSLQLPARAIQTYLRQASEVSPTDLKIRLHTQVPMKSGLGGSSALMVALTRGLGNVWGHFQNQGWQWEMLQWVKDVEAAQIKSPTGTQDYLASLLGGFRCYYSLAGTVEEKAYGADVLAGFNERLLVIFSGESHESGLSNWEVFKQAVQGEPALIRGLKRIQEIAEALDQALGKSVNWKHVGGLLSEEWRCRRDFLKVQTPTVEKLISQLEEYGVLGAKVCGAAQGGSILALVEPDQRKAITRKCQAAGLQVLPTRAQTAGVEVENL